MWATLCVDAQGTKRNLSIHARAQSPGGGFTVAPGIEPCSGGTYN